MTRPGGGGGGGGGARERTPIIDAHDNVAPAIRLDHTHPRAEGEGAVSRGHAGGIETLAIRRACAMAVEGCGPGLEGFAGSAEAGIERGARIASLRRLLERRNAGCNEKRDPGQRAGPACEFAGKVAGIATATRAGYRLISFILGSQSVSR